MIGPQHLDAAVRRQEHFGVQRFQYGQAVRHGVDEQIDGQLIQDGLERVVAEAVHEIGRLPVLRVLVQQKNALDGEPGADVSYGHRTHQLREPVHPIRVPPLHLLHVHSQAIPVRFDSIAQRLYRLGVVRVPRGRRVGQRRRRQRHHGSAAFRIRFVVSVHRRHITPAEFDLAVRFFYCRTIMLKN